MRKLFVLILFISFILICGCTTDTSKLTYKSSKISLCNIDPPDECIITDHGSGLLYFECRELVFAKGFHEYMSSHSDLRVVSIDHVLSSACKENSIKGYFVIVEKK